MPGTRTVDGHRQHLSHGDAFDPTAGGAGTVVRAWRRHYQERGPAVVLIEAGGRTLTWSELEARSRRLAGRLAGVGLEAGDRILFSAGASIDLVVAHVASLRLGLVVVPTNTAYRDAEIAHVVGDATPKAAVVDAAERGQWIVDRDPSVLVVTPAVDLPDAAPPTLDEAAPDAPALMGYTSGTTGRPKGAVLTQANLLASVEALRLAWRWTVQDRLVLSLPLFHMHGLGVGLHGTLHVGGSTVLLPRFDPDAVMDAIEAHDASLFFGVPTLYHRLVDHPRVDTLARLRLCVSGSAPLPAALHRAFEEATGQRIVERYGMTETAMLVSNPVEGERRPGTVGLPLPGVSVRLRDEPPEIEVRGANVFSGYWQRPEANAEAFTEDGWFRTGDLGELDDAGYVRIAGRAKELIISGGYNVYPREVEEAVRTHPLVEDAAVVGTADPEWGEAVTAYLVSSEAVTAAELREYLADQLAPYKHPRIVHRVDALPRNALGKVQKHRLEAGAVLPEAS